MDSVVLIVPVWQTSNSSFILNTIFVPMSQADSRSINVVVVV